MEIASVGGRSSSLHPRWTSRTSAAGIWGLGLAPFPLAPNFGERLCCSVPCTILDRCTGFSPLVVWRLMRHIDAVVLPHPAHA